MTSLPLTAGYEVIVDEDVAEWLGNYNWRLDTLSAKYKYAMRTITHERQRIKLFMHRLVGNIPAEFRVGMRNGNYLDCRRENIIVKDQYGEPVEKWKMSTKISDYHGVTWNWYRGAWEVSLFSTKHGVYPSEIDAAMAYNEIMHRMKKRTPKLNSLPRILNVTCC